LVRVALAAIAFPLSVAGVFFNPPPERCCPGRPAGSSKATATRPRWFEYSVTSFRSADGPEYHAVGLHADRQRPLHGAGPHVNDRHRPVRAKRPPASGEWTRPPKPSMNVDAKSTTGSSSGQSGAAPAALTSSPWVPRVSRSGGRLGGAAQTGSPAGAGEPDVSTASSEPTNQGVPVMGHRHRARHGRSTPTTASAPSCRSSISWSARGW
jgi:hypothetical protein